MTRTRSSKLVLYGLFSYTGIVLLGTGAIVFFIQNQALKTNLINLTFPFWNLFAAFSLLVAAKRSAVVSSRLSLAWFVLASAQFCYTIGDVIWSVFETGLGQDPFPSLADGFYVAYYPLFLLGILLLPVKRLSRMNYLKSLIDISIVMLSALLAFSLYLLGPLVVSGSDESLLLQLLSLAYPMGDLVLLLALLMLLFRKPDGQHPTPLLLIVAGAAFLILSDSLYGYQSIIGNYTTGGLADLGWTIAYLLFTCAGVFQALFVQPKTHQPRTLPALANNYGINDRVIYFPYTWLIAAYLLLIQSYYYETLLDYSWIAIVVGAVIGLVLARQILTMTENNNLFLELSEAFSLVRRQTLNLRNLNQDLQIEISERKRAEEKLAHDALHDSLTDLPNRSLFLNRLKHAIEVGKRRSYFSFAVLFLDIDHFKVVNDSLGHSAGDQLLLTVSHRLSACVRGSDTVARLGGDEFVILLEDSGGLDDVIKVAGRIQEELQKPIDLGAKKAFVSASIGIISNLTGYSETEDVLRDADLAMYHAKSQGKARYEIFSIEMRDRAITILELERELFSALERCELALDYQPIVSLSSERIIGFEALLRWRHPERGLIAPAEFIPVAEKSGLIIPIGYWVLQEACSQARAWQIKYPDWVDLTMNVNISGVQLNQPDFADQLAQILIATGLDGNSLKLEITESTYLNSLQIDSDSIRKIGDIGVGFQIDDFGTRYSSLSSLRDYHIQAIKIDRSFISKLREKDKTEIVRTFIKLAHDLGVQTIAEGVETEEQLRSLKSLGCNYGQGYLLSYPINQAEIEDLLSKITTVREDKILLRRTLGLKMVDPV
jgi:diguanylate cyclase (GGDEF)-like protein